MKSFATTLCLGLENTPPLLPSLKPNSIFLLNVVGEHSPLNLDMKMVRFWRFSPRNQRTFKNIIIDVLLRVSMKPRAIYGARKVEFVHFKETIVAMSYLFTCRTFLSSLSIRVLSCSLHCWRLGTSSVSMRSANSKLSALDFLILPCISGLSTAVLVLRFDNKLMTIVTDEYCNND